MIIRTHDSYEVTMNFLMSMALEKVAYLPFAFMVDQVGSMISLDELKQYNFILLHKLEKIQQGFSRHLW